MSTTYSLNGRAAPAEYAALALLDLLPKDECPNRVLVLLTQDAKSKTWERFARGVTKRGIEIEAVDIPDGDDAKQVNEILDKLVERIPSGVRLSLDITYGPRHIPFVNLRPLLELPQWFYAVRVFQDTGATKTLARRFEATVQTLPAGPERGPPQQVTLNEGELQRQAKLIDDYLERGQLAQGIIGLMREWVVSLGVPHRYRGNNWLDRKKRIAIERELGALAQVLATDTVPSLCRCFQNQLAYALSDDFRWSPERPNSDILSSTLSDPFQRCPWETHFS